MDLTYYFEKLYNGTTSVKSSQPDKAALAKVLVPGVRERLGELQSSCFMIGSKLWGRANGAGVTFGKFQGTGDARS